MRIVLFCSAFNGLSQRAWIDLRAAGHRVTVHLASDAKPIERVCRDLDPDLVICPFLKDRVPESVWRHHRTIIIHPGPMGDRGPSSLDWAIAEGHRQWGVTALQAVEEMDAGPIWATRTFPLPAEPLRKSALYNGPVADAAAELIAEVVEKAGDPGFVPRPLVYGPSDVTGRLRPLMTQSDRAFSWDGPTRDIVRTIRAADGSPGVRTELAGQPVSAFDAHPGPARDARPGAIVGRSHGAVLVATGDGSVWLGRLRSRVEGRPSIKLPATAVLRDHLGAVPTILAAGTPEAGGISYRRAGQVGVVSFECYNGAMSTAQCRRLTTAVRRAAAADTKVVVLRGGEFFSNGIDLNTIEAAGDPAAEGWANINAIDDLCRAIITCTDQLVIASVGANAGAGGVMLALGADRVDIRRSVVLNPHYASMGLYGSEYWTYVLPRRTGWDEAERLTSACLPIGADHAVAIGLADRVLGGGRDEFEATVLDGAQSMASHPAIDGLLRAKRDRLAADERRKPLSAYRHEELGQMSRDLFDDRSGFQQARHAFVHKHVPDRTPPHLVAA